MPHTSTDNKRSATYIALKARLFGPGCLYSEDDKDSVIILESYKGTDLKGKCYIPPFQYFLDRKDTAFRVLTDTYVTDDSGTGIVHNAPGHGEVGYYVYHNQKIINCSISDPLLRVSNSNFVYLQWSTTHW